GRPREPRGRSGRAQHRTKTLEKSTRRRMCTPLTGVPSPIEGNEGGSVRLLLLETRQNAHPSGGGAMAVLRTVTVGYAARFVVVAIAAILLAAFVAPPARAASVDSTVLADRA